MDCDKDSCPNCRTKIGPDLLVPNLFFNNQVMRLVCYCPNKRMDLFLEQKAENFEMVEKNVGCEWVGPFNGLQHHW